jgi:hypothetical protein
VAPQRVEQRDEAIDLLVRVVIGVWRAAGMELAQQRGCKDSRATQAGCEQSTDDARRSATQPTPGGGGVAVSARQREPSRHVLRRYPRRAARRIRG